MYYCSSHPLIPNQHPPVGVVCKNPKELFSGTPTPIHLAPLGGSRNMEIFLYSNVGGSVIISHDMLLDVEKMTPFENKQIIFFRWMRPPPPDWKKHITHKKGSMKLTFHIFLSGESVGLMFFNPHPPKKGDIHHKSYSPQWILHDFYSFPWHTNGNTTTTSVRKKNMGLSPHHQRRASRHSAAQFRPPGSQKHHHVDSVGWHCHLESWYLSKNPDLDDPPWN